MLVVFLSCALCVVLTFFRFYISHATVYAFLLWNLCLALIPFALSMVIFTSTSKWRILFLLMGWLLFFPNAPYLVTDLFHYGHLPPVPQGYDMAMLVAYAWCGLILGHLSVLFIHHAIRRMINNWVAWPLVFISLFLGAFGVYLGRFLRWNSWDVFFNHERVFHDIYSIFSDPVIYKWSWAIIVLTFAFLLIGYFFIWQLVNFGKHLESETIQDTG